MICGLAFGMGGIGAAVLGELADWTSIEFVYRVCSFLPMIGLLTVFLPNVEESSAATGLASVTNDHGQVIMRASHSPYGFGLTALLCHCLECQRRTGAGGPAACGR